MKKFLLLVVAMLAALMAQAVTVRLDIDDASRVNIDVNGTPVADISTGLNTLDVESGSYVTVAAAPGNMLLSVTETNGDYTYDMPIHAEDGRQFAIISVYADYGDTYVVRSASSGDVRTATMLLNVDRAQALRAVLPDTDTVLDLHDGENEIRFNPTQETTIKLTPTGKDFYQVLLDGVLQPSAYSYTLPIADDTHIDVVAQYPDIDYTVRLILEGDEAESFISTVDVDGRPVFDFIGPGFTVKAGSELRLTGNTRDYEVMSFTINGYSATFANPTTILVTDNVDLYFSVRKYATFPVTIDVDDADHVVLYNGYRYNNDVVTLSPSGSTVVDVTRNNPRLQLVAAEGYYIESVSLTDEELPVEDLKHPVVDLYPLYDNDVIVIRTGRINRDETAAVYLHGTELAEGYLTFARANGTAPVAELTDGFHVFPFFERDNPFSLGTGAPVPAYVYLNDMEIDPRFPDSPDYDVTFADCDVLKVYFGDRPLQYSVRIKTLIDTRYAQPYLEITKDMIQPLDFDMDINMDNVLQGSVLLLHRINKTDLTWFIGSHENSDDAEMISFNEDNNYQFAVDRNVVIWNEPLGAVCETGNNASAATEWFAPDGSRLAVPVRGINIMRCDDGTTSKVMIK